MLKKKLIFSLLIAATLFFVVSKAAPIRIPLTENSVKTPIDIAHESMKKVVAEFEYAADGVSREAFEVAVAGFYNIEGRKKDVLTLIDFTLPSTEPRLWVIDMLEHKVLISSHVAHGRNSGENYATSFSNESGSYQSSLGFYLTENTYNGGNGYSLVLNGLEHSNDNAKNRAIVVHGADYANPDLIAKQGRLGRSLGCPALPRAVTKEIIDQIKDGSVLYIYGKQ